MTKPTGYSYNKLPFPRNKYLNVPQSANGKRKVQYYDDEDQKGDDDDQNDSD